MAESNWRVINEATEVVPLDRLTPHPRNPRQGDVGAIHESVAANGFYGSVVAQRSTGRILAGNHRWLAAKQAGAADIPVTWVDVDDATALRILLADNRTNDLASYDTAELADLLQEIMADAGTLLGTAYDADALDELLADLGREDEKPADPGAQIDRAEELREKWGTERGQIWGIPSKTCPGKTHRLMCGDSTSAEDVGRLMGGEKPGVCLSDPPYGIDAVKVQGAATAGLVGGGGPFGGVKGATGGANPFGGRGRVHGPARKAIIAPRLYAPVIGDESTDTARAAYKVADALKPDVQIWWGGNYYADGLPPSRCWLVWDKENTGNFADAELAWTNIDKPVRIFRHMWNGLMKASERGEARVHPTQKPVELAAWCLREHAPDAETMLDLFGGSGWSAVAAEQERRMAYVMELSPDYCAVILERLTGMGLAPFRITRDEAA